MYREHAGPALPDPWATAKTNAKNCGYVQLGAVGMAGLSVVLGILQLGPGSAFMRVVGRETTATVFISAIAYVVVMGIWAGLNAWGLNRRSRVAHWSSTAIAIVMILSCFSWMFGAALLFLLNKREMKGFYESDLPTT